MKSDYDEAFDALMDRVGDRLDQLDTILVDGLQDMANIVGDRYRSAVRTVAAAASVPLSPGFSNSAMACAWPQGAAYLAAVDGLSAEDLHVTIRYLGDNDKLSEAKGQTIRDVMDAACLQAAPLVLRNGTYQHFGNPEEMLGFVAVVIAWDQADAPDLYDLAARAHDGLDHIGAPSKSSFDWHAHMTLAYLPKGEAERRYPVGDLYGADVTLDQVGAKLGEETWRRTLTDSTPIVAAGTVDPPAPPVGDVEDYWDAATWEAIVADAEDIVIDVVHSEGLHVGLNWKVTAPEIADIAALHVASIEGMESVAKTHLSNTITQSVQNGWSVKRTASRLTGGPFGAGQAGNLAQTEVISAANVSAHRAFVQTAQDGDTKTWLATPDNRTRDTHITAGREQRDIPFDQPFVVGGESCECPGDSALTEKERNRCRCTFIFNRHPQNKRTVVSSANPPNESSDAPTLKPTSVMAREATRALAWAASDDAAGDQPLSTLELGQRIADREELSESELAQIAQTWETHHHGLGLDGGKSNEPGFPNEWRIRTSLVGGQEGVTWARRKTRQLSRSHSADTVALDTQETDNMTDPDAASPIVAAADDADADVMDWESLLAVEGIQTGDGRRIDVGALIWRDLPLSLLFQDASSGGHDGARFAGSIRKITRLQNEIHGQGVWDSGDWGKEAARMVRDKTVKGISVDLTDMEYEFVYPENITEDVFVEPELMIITKATISAATIVSIPAFSQAFIRLIDEEDPEGNTVRFHGLAAAAGPDGTQPMAARVYIPLDSSKDGAMVASAAITEPAASTMFSAEDKAAAMHPTPDAFAERDYSDGPTPYTVEGHTVFGHIALFGSCHIGIRDRCQDVPRSATDYAAFHGEHPDVEGGTHVVCSDGSRVNVGRLFTNTVHPDLSRIASDAASHYADTGTLGAFVRAYETEWGVAVSGVVNPGISDEALFAMRASDVSGDWRPLGGSLELVGLLSVNVGGFNKAIAASAGQSLPRLAFRTLVAASGEVKALVGGHSRLHAAKVASRSFAERLATLEDHLGLAPEPCDDCDDGELSDNVADNVNDMTDDEISAALGIDMDPELTDLSSVLELA